MSIFSCFSPSSSTAGADCCTGCGISCPMSLRSLSSLPARFMSSVFRFSSMVFPPSCPSSVGQPDLWAHGENIISVLSPNYNFSLQNRSKSSIVDHSYIAMSGASMATPMVSGMAACLLERFPNLTPSQVKQRLCAAAEKNGGLLEPSCLPE